MSTDTIARIALDELHEGAFNERKVFDDASLVSFAQNIRHEGILQPLLVRPRMPELFKGDPDAIVGYEVVCGARRLRAARLLALPDAPCIVRTMSDAEAKSANVSENLQRENVHALEEAEALRSLMEDEKIGVDALITRTGKSRSYVYGRLKLLTLAKPVREAFAKGKIVGEIALLFARMPSEKLQLDALEKIQSDANYREREAYKEGGGPEGKGYRSIRDFLVERYALGLKGALWKLDDAELLPIAGACTTCPKRSGCTPELFGDIVSGDADAKVDGVKMHHPGWKQSGDNVCTDPDCYALKKKLQLKREKTALEAKGKTVIDGGKARQIVSADGDIKNGYIQASKVRDLIKQKKADVEISVVQDPRRGKTTEVVKIEDLKAAGVKVAEPKSSSPRQAHDSAADRAKVEAMQRERQEQTEANWRLYEAVRSAAVGRALGIDELRLVALRVVGDAVESDDGDMLRKAWSFTGWPTHQQIEKRLAAATPAMLTQMILDAIYVEDVEITQWGDAEGAPAALLAAAKRYGVDAKAVMAPPKPAAEAPAAQATAKAPSKKKATAKGKKAADAADEVKDDAGVAGEAQASLEESTA